MSTKDAKENGNPVVIPIDRRDTAAIQAAAAELNAIRAKAGLVAIAFQREIAALSASTAEAEKKLALLNRQLIDRYGAAEGMFLDYQKSELRRQPTSN